MAQTKIPPGGDFFDKQHAGMHKSFGFGGSVDVPQGHPMGHKPGRVERRFDGSTVIHHQHGGKTVNHLGGHTTHHKKTGTLIPAPHAIEPAAPPGPMGPVMNDGDADDMMPPAGMKTGGRVKRAEGGPTPISRVGEGRSAHAASRKGTGEDKPIQPMQDWDDTPATDRVNKAEGGRIGLSDDDNDDGLRTMRMNVNRIRVYEDSPGKLSPIYREQRGLADRKGSTALDTVDDSPVMTKHAKGGRVRKASGGEADESYSTSRSALARLKDADSEPSRSAEVYERTKKATGGRVRVPKGMKARAMMPRSPINTPPRNPKITRTPDDSMPAGDLPYGVQPSTEKGYQPLNTTTDGPRDALSGMKKGGRAKR